MASSKAKIKGKGRGGFNKLSSKAAKLKESTKRFNRKRKQFKNNLSLILASEE